MATSQELTAAVQQLNAQMATVKLENQGLRQSLQAQAATIQQLQQRQPQPVAPTPAVPSQVVTVQPLPPPPSSGVYSGDPRALKEFWQACKVQFLLHPNAFLTDASKTAYVISYLTANALAWASPLVLASDPLLNNFLAFETAFMSMFKRTSCIYAAEEALLEINQGSRDIQTYTARFKTLLAEVNWPENVQITAFRRGLREELKDELARLDRPTTLLQLIESALQLEFRLAERRIERRRSTIPSGIRKPITRQDSMTSVPVPVSSEEPMQVDTVRGPLTPHERQRRRENNLCLYCGSASHLLRTCPLCPRRRSEN